MGFPRVLAVFAAVTALIAGLWPLLAAAELGTGHLVVGQADSAGQTGVRGSGGDPGAMSPATSWLSC